jgi:hypothetical protein
MINLQDLIDLLEEDISHYPANSEYVRGMTVAKHYILDNRTTLEARMRGTIRFKLSVYMNTWTARLLGVNSYGMRLISYGEDGDAREKVIEMATNFAKSLGMEAEFVEETK